jgi:hypothetical protein
MAHVVDAWFGAPWLNHGFVAAIRMFLVILKRIVVSFLFIATVWTFSASATTEAFSNATYRKPFGQNSQPSWK